MNKLRTILPLLLALAVLLCAVACDKPVQPGEPSQDAAKATDQTAKVTEEAPEGSDSSAAVKETEAPAKATETPEVPERTAMTWAEYNQYCLDLLGGKQREAVHPETLRYGCQVYFRFENGEVTVFESCKNWPRHDYKLGEPIRSLPSGAFIPTPHEGCMPNEAGYYFNWYSPPDLYPDAVRIYRGYLGEDWAMLVTDPGAGKDYSVMISTDDGWQTGVLTEGPSNRHKSGAGRCGDLLFAGSDYTWIDDLEGYPAFFRKGVTDDEWTQVKLTVPEYVVYNALPRPLCPVFDGERGILPVVLDLGTGEFLPPIFFVTEDGGLTWEAMEG